MRLQYFIVSCEKSGIFYLTSSVIKNIVAPPTRSKFPVRLICCINFG